MKSLGLLLTDAAKLIRAEFERQARAHKMTLSQWRALKELSDGDGLTQTALGCAIELSPMTVSELLDRLEQQGLVRRETDPADSRAKLVWMTDAAWPLIEEMRQIAHELFDRALVGLTPAERDILMKGLEQIVVNLDGATANKKEIA